MKMKTRMPNPNPTGLFNAAIITSECAENLPRPESQKPGKNHQRTENQPANLIHSSALTPPQRLRQSQPKNQSHGKPAKMRQHVRPGRQSKQNEQHQARGQTGQNISPHQRRFPPQPERLTRKQTERAHHHAGRAKAQARSRPQSPPQEISRDAGQVSREQANAGSVTPHSQTEKQQPYCGIAGNMGWIGM